MQTWNPFLLIYSFIQYVLSRLLSPAPPPPQAKLHRPRIAIIGAGLTGVSAAAHCIGHGFDVQLFESRPRENLGGIWSRVNSTSGLQIHSVMYRFHPDVHWDAGYPAKDQILQQVTHLWKKYGLNRKTKFDTEVTSVMKNEKGRWIVNSNTSYGAFDGVIAAIGTCGDPIMPKMPGMEDYQGVIMHSSELDGNDVKGKNVAIIGGGASAIEALEYAFHHEAKQVKILSRVST
jgi:cation diffusion facilitator CzcD-associated flavoprotein CzcO